MSLSPIPPAQTSSQTSTPRPLRVLLSVFLCLLALVLLLPILAVLASTLQWNAESAQILREMTSTVLPDYALTTLLLCVAVAVGVAVVGMATAAAVTLFDFAGRKTFEWALLLPLAMPAYVVAYAYTDFLQFSGPLQTAIRATFGVEGRVFPEVRSLGGAAWVFTFCLYPYVYLLARTAFAERGAELFEAARTLGLNARAAWWRAALPVARPAIAGGALLVLMETLADFGTVSYFGVETLTTGIYRAWQNMGDLVAAAQLAALLLTAVIVLVWLERRNRRRARYANTRARHVSSARIGLPISQVAAWGRTLLCLLPLTLGFVLPAILLLRLLEREWVTVSVAAVLKWTGNSLLVGGLAALVAVSLSLLLHARARLLRERWALRIERLLSFGYAVPGAVLAIGVLLPLAWMDNQIIAASKQWWGVNPGLLLTGSVLALVYASSIRFYGVASSNISAAYARLPLHLDDSARVLGVSGWKAFARVHWPALKRSAIAATLLVFIDTLKELPATLTLRPFNFDTLATQTFNLVKDERLGEAALPSLLILLASLPAVALLARVNHHKNNQTRR